MATEIDLDDAVGKELLATFENWGDLLLVFEGPEVVCLMAHQASWADDEAAIEMEVFCLSTWIRFADDLVKLGVVTQAEVDGVNNAKLEAKRKDLEAKKADSRVRSRKGKTTKVSRCGGTWKSLLGATSPAFAK